MKARKVTQYRCDHCRRASLSASAMAKHEAWCLFNPQRKCPDCERVGAVEVPAVVMKGGFCEVKGSAGQCPNCLRSAVARNNRGAVGVEDTWINYSKEQYQADLYAYRTGGYSPKWVRFMKEQTGVYT